jgi:hypothetical protein
MKKYFSSVSGFTLVELALVLLVIGLVTGLILPRLGAFTFWQQEAFLRKLNETIVFLHHQAVADQTFYRLDFEPDGYQVRVIRPEENEHDEFLTELAIDAGNLSLELSAFLNPSPGHNYTLIPPPAFPSLAEAVKIPGNGRIVSLRTPRGRKSVSEKGDSYILFSPRGYSEFAVINLILSSGQKVTIVVNSFTGNTTILRDELDFEWSYGRTQN